MTKRSSTSLNTQVIAESLDGDNNKISQTYYHTSTFEGIRDYNEIILLCFINVPQQGLNGMKGALKHVQA